MKLSSDAMLEIVDIMRRGLAEKRDVSENLRELDLEKSDDDLLRLSDTYLADKGRPLASL